MPKFVCLIPCRLNSRRLPNKALLPIGPLTLIETVYWNTVKAVSRSSINADVFVCTDSPDIEQVLLKSNINYLMTKDTHTNGTERIAEAFARYNLQYDYIIDVQGDEPFVTESMISLVADSISSYPPIEPHIVLPHQVINEDEASRSSIVKVVSDIYGRVLYLTRSSIPFTHRPWSTLTCPATFKKHLSVIGFTSSALLLYPKLERSPLAVLEDIELLVALEHAIPIHTKLSGESTFSIDTEEDLHKARLLLS